ncbi:uncharacterized protein LOC116339913 [Contarinia nasturtii]|uniref:uncharacterized protein LOC116339913 n=1 Tax=Contarinia nasturtii TaxID=265458 RepID=UPI0012D42B38|nr:uncharacterized protein LOC116339913 [Contarinia nasturtii]
MDKAIEMIDEVESRSNTELSDLESAIVNIAKIAATAGCDMWKVFLKTQASNIKIVSTVDPRDAAEEEEAKLQILIKIFQKVITSLLFLPKPEENSETSGEKNETRFFQHIIIGNVTNSMLNMINCSISIGRK